MKGKLIYILVGIILITGIFTSRVEDIDKETLRLIEEAHSLGIGDDLWPGFKLSEYSLDVNYGKVEFNYFAGNIKRKKPSQEVLAIAMVIEDNGPVIKVIPEDMVRKISAPMGNMNKKERDNFYISVLFHEGFHCLQYSSGLELSIDEYDPFSSEFANILNGLDNDYKYRELWIKEIKYLRDFLDGNNKDLWIEAYSVRMKYLKEKLGEDFDFYVKMEDRIEIIEGSARYIEGRVLEELTGEFKEAIIPNMYHDGIEKYYAVGRLKALILDKNDKEGKWKKDLFYFKKSMASLIMDK